MNIQGRIISEEMPPYCIAEMSGNHGGKIDQAKAIIRSAKESGADAIKIQTYTADTLTLNARNEYFKLNNGGLWDGQYFYDLYSKGSLPWEWHEELFDYARSLGITLFSTPFDESAVDFLEKLDVPAYKIASFELTHLPLLKKVAETGKPIILSTGMGSEEEIEEAVGTLRSNECKDFVLLKCISSYPARPESFNLKTLPLLREKFGCLVGLSDHSLSNEICLGAVALGACVIEKHFVLDRDEDVIDGAFSLMPEEFAQMVQSAKMLYSALGNASIGISEQETGELRSRRSIFISKDIQSGEVFSKENLKIVRPADGLFPKYWDAVLGKKAAKDLSFGHPLTQSDIL